MAATKSRTSLFSAQSAASTADSSWIDLSASYGATINAKVTNSSTGPSVAPTIQVEVANDYNSGSPTLVTYFGGSWTPGTANSGVYYLSVELPFGIAAARLSITGAATTTGTVTLDADISKVTAV